MRYGGHLRVGDLVIVDRVAWARGSNRYPSHFPSRFYRACRDDAHVSVAFGTRQLTVDVADGTVGLITRADIDFVEVVLSIDDGVDEHAVLYGSDCCVLYLLT